MNLSSQFTFHIPFTKSTSQEYESADPLVWKDVMQELSHIYSAVAGSAVFHFEEATVMGERYLDMLPTFYPRTEAIKYFGEHLPARRRV
jgi:hypothetical protein